MFPFDPWQLGNMFVGAALQPGQFAPFLDQMGLPPPTAGGNFFGGDPTLNLTGSDTLPTNQETLNFGANIPYNMGGMFPPGGQPSAVAQPGTNPQMGVRPPAPIHGQLGMQPQPSDVGEPGDPFAQMLAALPQRNPVPGVELSGGQMGGQPPMTTFDPNAPAGWPSIAEIAGMTSMDPNSLPGMQLPPNAPPPVNPNIVPSTTSVTAGNDARPPGIMNLDGPPDATAPPPAVATNPPPSPPPPAPVAAPDSRIASGPNNNLLAALLRPNPVIQPPPPITPIMTGGVGAGTRPHTPSPAKSSTAAQMLLAALMGGAGGQRNPLRVPPVGALLGV